MTPEEGAKWIRTFGFVPGEFYVLVFDCNQIDPTHIEYLVRYMFECGIKAAIIGTNRIDSIRAIHVNRDDIAELKQAILALPEQES